MQLVWFRESHEMSKQQKRIGIVAATAFAVVAAVVFFVWAPGESVADDVDTNAKTPVVAKAVKPNAGKAEAPAKAVVPAAKAKAPAAPKPAPAPAPKPVAKAAAEQAAAGSAN